MWFLLSLAAIACWGGSDLLSKIASPSDDRYSHWKIVMAVGLVMGIHATAEILLGEKFYPADFINYLPAVACYVSSMIIGYAGLRYLMLSVSSPICNSSGAVACILCLIFLNRLPDRFSAVGIILVCSGVLMLAIVEKRYENSDCDDKKHTKSLLAILFPVFYCLLDGLGTFADALLLDTGAVGEASANIAYEYTFCVMGVFAFIYVVLIKKVRLSFRDAVPKLSAAICETAGQYAYIYAIGDSPAVAAPMISSYCVFSVLLSRIFLKEKLTAKHYLSILTVVAGIVFLGISDF